MAQLTARTVEQALRWIHENAHHEVGPHWAKGHRDPSTGIMLDPTGTLYRNYLDVLIVPDRLRAEIGRLTIPNDRPFDTRMFKLTAAGRRRINARSAVA